MIPHIWMVRKHKSLETKCRLVVAWGCMGMSTENGHRESFGVYGNVLKLDDDDSYTTV